MVFCSINIPCIYSFTFDGLLDGFWYFTILTCCNFVYISFCTWASFSGLVLLKKCSPQIGHSSPNYCGLWQDEESVTEQVNYVTKHPVQYTLAFHSQTFSRKEVMSWFTFCASTLSSHGFGGTAPDHIKMEFLGHWGCDLVLLCTAKLLSTAILPIYSPILFETSHFFHILNHS